MEWIQLLCSNCDNNWTRSDCLSPLRLNSSQRDAPWQPQRAKDRSQRLARTIAGGANRVEEIYKVRKAVVNQALTQRHSEVS